LKDGAGINTCPVECGGRASFVLLLQLDLLLWLWMQLGPRWLVLLLYLKLLLWLCMD
jgi:hypothetical protein